MRKSCVWMIAAAAVVSGFTVNANAANIEWLGTTNGVWTTGANWAGGAAPGYGVGVLIDGGSSTTNTAITGINYFRQAGVTFAAGAPAYTIGVVGANPNGASTQILDDQSSGSVAVSVASGIANAETVNYNMSEGSNGNLIFSNAGTGLLTIGGNIAGTNAGGTSTILANTASSGATLFSGTLSDNSAASASNLMGVNNAGAGTVTLSGANTYTGTTKVTGAGAIYVNNTSGSGTGTGAVSTTATGGTVGGSGSISGSVTTVAGSTLAPGAAANTIGTLSVGSAAVAGTLKVDYDIAAGTKTDLLADTGALDISAATVNFNNLNVSSLALTGPSYIFATYGSLVGSAFATVTNLPTGYAINYAYGGNNIALVATPEPASIGALAMMGLTLVGRRRRQA